MMNADMKYNEQRVFNGSTKCESQPTSSSMSSSLGSSKPFSVPSGLNQHPSLTTPASGGGASQQHAPLVSTSSVGSSHVLVSNVSGGGGGGVGGLHHHHQHQHRHIAQSAHHHFPMFHSNSHPLSHQAAGGQPKGLYRINSALDLDHPDTVENGLRREFGSVSSIDALTGNPDGPAFYSYFKQFKHDQQQHHHHHLPSSVSQSSNFSSALTSSRQPNLPKSVSTASDFQASSKSSASSSSAQQASQQAYVTGLANSSLALDIDPSSVASPSIRKKLVKLWDKNDKTKQKSGSTTLFASSGTAATTAGSKSSNGRDACDQTSLASSTNTTNNNSTNKVVKKDLAIFRKITRLASTKQTSTEQSFDLDDPCAGNSRLSASAQRLDDPEVRFEEKLRRKAFAHYDCQSLTANLSTASRLCHLLSKRRNTTTGASAASIGSKFTGNSQDGSSINENDLSTGDQPLDAGDDRSNELLLSCPFFRNELGGEEERQVALSRYTADRSGRGTGPVLHQPHMAAGLTLLEDANERRWKLKCCPYQRGIWATVPGAFNCNSTSGAFGLPASTTAQLERNFTIEHYDIGTTYYRQHFYGLEHQNWFGNDEHLGPVAVSIRRERVPVDLNETSAQSDQQLGQASQSGGPSYTAAQAAAPGTGSLQPSSVASNPPTKNQYRLIIRTSELSVLRGAVHEDALPFLQNGGSTGRHNHQHSNHHAKEVLEYVAPELNLSCLKLGVSSADEQLLKLDEQSLTRNYKVGVMYCRAEQTTEEEMYNNQHSSAALDAFLDCIGKRVRLAGFEKYRAGLDNKSDTTGTHSVHATYGDAEIMFHVSTMLPYTPNNRQQLLRKRHIGNDIVTIVFQEPDAPPFTPKCIRSHFQHVFIVVRQLPPLSTGTQAKAGPIRYAVAVSRSKDVPVFGPPIPAGGQFIRGRAFAQFLLAKIINAENAAHRSEKFRQMAQRTRQEYLKDLATSHCTNTTIHEASGSSSSAGAKFVSSIFGGGRKNRRERAGRDSQFVFHRAIKGAICWEMSVEDFGQSKVVDCVVAVSCDTFLLIEQSSRQTIFVCGCQQVLGWSSHPNLIKIFFHQGECILLKCKDPDLDEIGELVNRLRAVTIGCETQEIILRRNNQGQLGFHVGFDGIVSHVELYAYAWQAGLRRCARIVEICKVAIATLTYEQMLDLLKTSITVTVTVLPPLNENTPRR